MTHNDHDERLQAIQPHTSYLVQAPAGSGKTELLIQRILGLLAIVDEPEEILALTFTRKAAAEMRERVFTALKQAQGEQPKEKHAQQTWHLAQQALLRSQSQSWRLIDCPSRLRIMTIDAFASGLARQLPLLSGFGQSPATADFSEPMYISAVDAVISYAQQKNAPAALQEALNTLILHQDCHMNRLRSLLCSMLTRREQWLKDVMHQTAHMPAFKQHIEQCLAMVIEHTLHDAKEALPIEVKGELLPLANFAADQLSLEQAQHNLLALKGLEQFPQADVASIQQWKAITNLLLTKNKPQVRKTVTKRDGFPAGKAFSSQKEGMLALLAMLQHEKSWMSKLHQVRLLPNHAQFDVASWQVLEALFIVLKTLAGQLWQTFEQHKKVDFVEVMLRAKQALGQEDEVGNIIPSEALLRLDYQIKHILVDEFQDTSSLQIDLLSRLTAGWEDDGRTLFMVGDPMQSIYRFRKAEVSLFLKAAENELPLPHVQSLVLSQNFRSSPNIVEWVNQAFSHVFPPENNALAGAITYAPSHAFKADTGSVTLHINVQSADNTNLSAEQEAMQILDVIQYSITKGRSVGVLARSRSHLSQLMHVLQREGVPFRALDMLSLDKQPEIIDLRSLTRALLHPCDHIAWASLLRSPMIGINLQSLHHIFHATPSSAWLALQVFAKESSNKEEQQRLNTFIQAIHPAMRDINRASLRSVIESAWLRMASPAMLSKAQLANSDAYFQLLETLEQEGQVDIAMLDARLTKLYAAPDTMQYAEQVELMTMHGAKGLQWDTVILPGLGKTPRAKDKEVLLQTEAFTHHGQQLLLAPLPQAGEEDGNASLMYSLIRDFEKQRDALEVGRLLYVACTRAERELHLFGHISEKSRAPKASSLLALLWQDETACFGADIDYIDHEADLFASQPEKIHSPAQHIPLTFQAQQALPAIEKSSASSTIQPMQHQPEFSWAGASAKAVGIALHLALQKVAEVGIEHWNQQHTQAILHVMTTTLRHEGISQTYLDDAIKRCQKGFYRCLKSKRAQWILSEQHQDQHQEWALTYVEDGCCKHVVLDRSFIDAQGTRWIIDYKTGGHEGANLNAFLDQELQRYTEETPQLPKYIQALQALEPERNIQAALYFPMVDGWRVWEVNQAK